MSHILICDLVENPPNRLIRGATAGLWLRETTNVGPGVLY
jgi:hypothetical protein